jgi:hypothetical protein
MGIPTSSISISFLTQSWGCWFIPGVPDSFSEFFLKHDAPQKNPNRKNINMNLICTALIFKSRNNHKGIGMTMNTS